MCCSVFESPANTESWATKFGEHLITKSNPPQLRARHRQHHRSPRHRIRPHTDISPARLARDLPSAQLRTASDDFRAVLVSGRLERVGSFCFHFDGERWEWSDAVARMHGYEPGEVVPTTALLLEHKHPDDRDSVADLLRRVLQDGEPFSSKHRIIDTAGKVHHVVVVGQRVMTDGQATGTSGFYIDVTDSVRRDIDRTITENLSAFIESRAVIETGEGRADGGLRHLRRTRIRCLLAHFVMLLRRWVEVTVVPGSPPHPWEEPAEPVEAPVDPCRRRHTNSMAEVVRLPPPMIGRTTTLSP